MAAKRAKPTPATTQARRPPRLPPRSRRPPTHPEPTPEAARAPEPPAKGTRVCPMCEREYKAYTAVLSSPACNRRARRLFPAGDVSLEDLPAKLAERAANAAGSGEGGETPDADGA